MSETLHLFYFNMETQAKKCLIAQINLYCGLNENCMV